MATFKISGELRFSFSDLEINAGSVEEALAKLYKMDVVNIVEDCCIKESDIVGEEAEISDSIIHVRAHHIDWDVTEDDLWDIDEDDLRSNGPEPYIKAIKDSLPKELDLMIDVDKTDDGCSIEEKICNAISDETSYCVTGYKFEVSPEDKAIYNYLSGK